MLSISSRTRRARTPISHNPYRLHNGAVGKVNMVARHFLGQPYFANMLLATEARAY